MFRCSFLKSDATEGARRDGVSAHDDFGFGESEYSSWCSGGWMYVYSGDCAMFRIPVYSLYLNFLSS